MLVLEVLSPVFLIIALGVVLERTRFVPMGFLREANRLTYWVGLPALLFGQLAGGDLRVSAAGPLMLVVIVGTLVVTGLGLLIGWLVHVPGPALGTFVQAGFRGNLAFVSLPILYAFPEMEVGSGLTLRTAGVVVLAPTMILYNLLSIIVLLFSQHRLGWAMLSPFLRQLFTTPPLVATLLGLIWVAAGWSLPAMAGKTLSSLGEMALPLGLLGVGGALANAKLGQQWRVPLAAAVVKTVLSPLCGWGLARLWGLGEGASLLVLVFMAAPTAIISYTVTLELKGDEALASGSIALSACASAVTLAAIVALVS